MAATSGHAPNDVLSSEPDDYQVGLRGYCARGTFNRSGFPKGVAAARGAAKSFNTPHDMKAAI